MTGVQTCALPICANLDLIESEQFFNDIDRISAKHTQFFHEIKGNENLSDVRQCGTIIALEIKVENQNYFSNIRDIAYNFFLENGLLIRPLGNVIFLNPPYCTTNDELDYMYKKMKEFLNEFITQNS